MRHRTRPARTTAPRTAVLLTAAAAAILGLPPGAAGQVIQIKTVPVAAGEQFLAFPSDRLGMGSISIALHDTLGDPFSNPSALTRLRETRLFGAPSAYGITDGNGGGMTLPLGVLGTASEWRWGVGMALQELDRGEAPTWFWTTTSVVWPGPPQSEMGQRYQTNLYGYGGLARVLGPVSVGASASVAELSGMAGVDLLYDRPPVSQDGHMYDLRLGLTSEPHAGGELEAIVLHSRLDMRHEFVSVIWEPVEDPALPPEEWEWRTRRVESTERDETATWGLHLGYARSLDPEGWTAGGIFTVNYKDHPKIPNYTLMSIPRDPGGSWAYDIGLGLSRRSASAVFGLDVIYEPIWTETWADAASPTPTASGDTIPVGDMTVFNDFRFSNAIIRMGIGGSADRLDVQAGLQVKRYRYTLDQTDFIAGIDRRQKEGWLEWRPSLSLGLRLDDFSIHYTGRITTGTGRPGVAGSTWWTRDVAVPLAAGDFLAAPSGALTLAEATVHMHQLRVEVPLGR